MSIFVTSLFILLLTSASAYRVLDVQSDEAIDLDLETEPKTDDDGINFVENSESMEQLWEDFAIARIVELEVANQELNKKLEQKEVQLQTKTNEIKKRKVAKVKLEPVDSEEKFGFWEFICGIARSAVQSFMSFFGIML